MACRLLKALGIFTLATAAMLGLALPAWAAQAITLTWVRHAQSTANADGIIDTTVPGPGLTTLGQTQANAIAATLHANGYDGVYVSDMVRTSLTAAPLAAERGIPPVVVAGLQEVDAGIFEGRSGLIAGLGYALPPVAWVLGARFVPVLGGENGNQFEARVNSAVDTIYATGETNPVIFSHGATMTAWTLMNVGNPDLLLAVTHPLGNTAVVVVTGDPQDGWTLQSWDGIAVDPNPGVLTSLFVAARAAVVAPQTAVYDAVHPTAPAPARGTRRPLTDARAVRSAPVSGEALRPANSASRRDGGGTRVRAAA
jgi:broad specificity phosphatase PhoE